MTRTAGRRRKNRFAAFDFAEEDERVEKEAKKLVSKFKQNECRLSGSPIDKYTFLQSFAPIPPQKSVTSNTTIDLDDDEVCVMKTQRKKVDDRSIDLKVAQGSKTRQKGISNRPIEHDAKVVRYQLAQGAKSRNSEISIGPIDVDADAEEDDIIKVGASGQDYEGGVGVISNSDDLIEMEGPQSQVVGLQTSLPRARYTRRHFQALEPSWNQLDLLHVEDSCSGTSSSDFQVISEMGPEFEGSSHLGRTDKPDSSSTSSEYLADCVVEDSEDDASDRHNYCESKRLLSSFSGDIPSSSNQEAELKRNAIGHSAAEVVQVDE
ncbi:hypothetical protein SLEP1_g10999 [Rubroshorea leprosula]|uniref:Uncharacterized protein n=1 Tax=Rubroshorea leprosula TaxID=152421 RepID=A0AAV5I9W2_9ROSI|nr:hypothetical protein SLEP1_g10999 [Rubroshorea leprosula]